MALLHGLSYSEADIRSIAALGLERAAAHPVLARHVAAHFLLIRERAAQDEAVDAETSTRLRCALRNCAVVMAPLRTAASQMGDAEASGGGGGDDDGADSSGGDSPKRYLGIAHADWLALFGEHSSMTTTGSLHVLGDIFGGAELAHAAREGLVAGLIGAVTGLGAGFIGRGRVPALLGWSPPVGSAADRGGPCRLPRWRGALTGALRHSVGASAVVAAVWYLFPKLHGWAVRPARSEAAHFATEAMVVGATVAAVSALHGPLGFALAPIVLYVPLAVSTDRSIPASVRVWFEEPDE
jgi:hypothetical protein